MFISGALTGEWAEGMARMRRDALPRFDAQTGIYKISAEENTVIYRIDNFIGTSNDSANLPEGLPADGSWLLYTLTDSEDYKMTVGSSDGSAYAVKASRKLADWEMSLCDFIGFHESRGKNIVLSLSQQELDRARKQYGSSKYNDNFLRKNEPKILVHSTSYENWLSIEKDGCLKCWNLLKKEKSSWEAEPIGIKLGDPADFSDFIMFSGGGISGEIVVSSKESKKIVMDPHRPYKTGARLYFDAEKIAEDGLLIRDGIHLKVEKELPLSPYLIWCAVWDNAGLTERISTPKEFTEKSNAAFEKLFGFKVSSDF